MTTTRRDALGMATTAGAVVSISACGGGEDTPSGSGGEVRIPVVDVPQEGGVVRDRVVVTQPAEGEFKAFDASCPHQGCAVEEVTAEAIVCPCHGSEFDPTSGDVTTGPAEKGLAERTATVDGDEVVVTEG